MSTQRFTILPCIDGYDVIDEDGRPVDHRDNARSANGVAYRLNEAARSGNLQRALRGGTGNPSDPLTQPGGISVIFPWERDAT